MILESILEVKDYLVIIGCLLLVLIGCFVLLAVVNNEKKLPKAIIKAFNLKPLLFFNKKNKFIGLTEHFVNLVSVYTENNWQDEIDGIIVSENNLSFEEFINYLKENDKVSVVLEINGKSLPLTLIKYTLLDDKGKLYGYTVVAKEENEDNKIIKSKAENMENDKKSEAFEKPYLDFTKLEAITEKLLKEDEFGAILLNFKNKDNYDVKNNYLQNVKTELLKENDYLIEADDNKYVLYILDINRFSEIIQCIKQDKSILVKNVISVNEQEYQIENTIGIVYSSDIKTKEELQDALNQSLALADSDGYEKCYSIFSPKKEETLEYSFEKIIVDLDNSFLNEEE